MTSAALQGHSTESRTQRGVLSKRTLSAVSHALEMAATALGPDAVVVGAFERHAYFKPRASAFQRLVGCGATVAVAYVGNRDTDGGGFQVPLHIDEAAAEVWALVLFSPTLCGYVNAIEHGSSADTTLGLEPARQFQSEIGFDGERTHEIIGELCEMFGDRLDPAVVDKINHVSDRRAQRHEPYPLESAWQSALGSLVAHTDTTFDAVREQAAAATRDQGGHPLGWPH